MQLVEAAYGSDSRRNRHWQGIDCIALARAQLALAVFMNFLELTKPPITTLVTFTTATALWLAPVRPRASAVFFTLIGTELVVAAANVLNMYLERDTDALMPCTMYRPLPRVEVCCCKPDTGIGFQSNDS